MEPTVSAGGAQIRVEYRPTRKDYLKIAVLSAVRSLPNATIGSSLIAIAILPVINGDLGSVVTLVIGIAVITGLYAIPFVAWMTRRRADLFFGPHELTVDSWGLRFATATVRTEQAWATFSRVREVGDACLLDYGTGANALIPRHAFDATSALRFRELADQAGKLDHSSPWRGLAIGTGIEVSLGVAFILAVSAMSPV